MAVAPLHQRQQCDPEFEAFLGEVVFEALGPFVVANAFEHSGLDEAGQAIREHVARDPEAPEQHVEAMVSDPDLADDQERPAVAHHLEGARDRAVLAFVVALQHEAKNIKNDLRDASELVYGHLHHATYTQEKPNEHRSNRNRMSPSILTSR